MSSMKALQGAAALTYDLWLSIFPVLARLENGFIVCQ
jgi:uncharacterized BrkB/YihY/UPF0761 family membrane protein